MKPLTLKDDLIRDFQDQKQTINEQLALIDPMAASMRAPAARRLLSAGLLVFLQVICWLLVLGCLAFVFFMDRIFPFHLIGRLLHDTAISDNYNPNHVMLLSWIIRGLAVFTALLFYIILRLLGSIRKKNNVLHLTGKNMRLLAEQLLKRKAAMDTLEQKHPVEMPSNADTVVVPAQKPHNDILL
jgi:hypothetical protein